MDEKQVVLGKIGQVTFVESKTDLPLSLYALYQHLSDSLTNKEITKVFNDQEIAELKKLFNEKTTAWIKEQEERKAPVIFPLSTISEDLPTRMRISKIQVNGSGEILAIEDMPSLRSLIKLINTLNTNQEQRSRNILQYRYQRTTRRGTIGIYDLPGFSCTVIAPQGRLNDYRFTPKPTE